MIIVDGALRQQQAGTTSESVENNTQ